MSEQTHLTSRSLQSARKPDKDVHVIFAVSPGTKAVLFIHGFSGDAINTWSDFPLMLPNSNKAIGRDLYFYGYDGLRADMNGSAALFRDFLDRLLSGTAELVNQNLPSAAKRPQDFAYEELVIVAHSLGAVITRRALLDATRLEMPWVQRIKLVLYAPAHRGASVVKLAVEAASSLPFLKLFAAFARFKSPLIDQLKPESTDLALLLTETLAACKDGKNHHLIAKKVLIAEYEDIVRNEAFGNDPPPDTIPETSHTSICKPKIGFSDPLEHLEKCL